MNENERNEIMKTEEAPLEEYTGGTSAGKVAAEIAVGGALIAGTAYGIKCVLVKKGIIKSKEEKEKAKEEQALDTLRKAGYIIDMPEDEVEVLEAEVVEEEETPKKTTKKNEKTK